MSAREYTRRAAAIALWAWGVWLLLTWTVTAEQLSFGAGLAIVVGLCLAPLGDAVGPWRLFTPRRLVAVAALAADAVVRAVRANLELSRRIWAPSRPVPSGMVVVPTAMRREGGLAATGLITSVIVDNQIVDVDTARHRLQYHAIAVAPGSPDDRAEQINAPIERGISRVEGDRR